ncbi:ATP-binding protein [Actinoallomurus sp. NPDC052308]|uniref:ATP-binding protein n=1 Tax=Actinoallomurus sp. NPDC052308 TaxID=3155530 RepID=UPI003431A6F4
MSTTRGSSPDGEVGATGFQPSAAIARAKWLAGSGRFRVRRPGTLYWRRRFPGTTEHISHARGFIRFLLADSAAAFDAAWVVGELATNAVRHSRSGSADGAFTVEVMRWGRFAQIQVTDAGDGRGPVLPRADAETVVARGEPPPESGFGLRGVGALARRFGTYRQPDGSRVGWARLPSDPFPGPAG